MIVDSQQLRAQRGLPDAQLVAPVGEGEPEEGYIQGNEEYFDEEIEEGFEAEEQG